MFPVNANPSTSDTMFYPWVMYLLTVRITEAFGLPKPILFCNVQRDVASLPSYSKLNLKCDSWEVTWYLTSCLLIVINHAIQIATFWWDNIFGA